jgi:isoleucyl-tRNA synthetase
MTKFKEYSNLNLSDINKEMLSQWSEKDIFHKSIETREGKPSFVFYEGPPSANGLPGIHHVMGRTIKDVFCRYKTMQGFQVKRKAGWDTHGLPVELGVEKALGITKEDIGKTISVDDYNAACRHDVLKYTKEWEDLTTKMGYWVDMNDPYITYDNRYIETLWWLLKQLYNKNLLYKGYTIQPFSPAAGTGLSTHELNQPGCYRDVKDTTCVAQFKIKNPPPKSPIGDLLDSANNEADKLKCLTANPLLYSKIKELAQKHRKNPTQAEDALWSQLRSKQLDGYKFRRQHIIADCIVDFVCIDAKLVIEVDGGYHEKSDVVEYDKLRTELLESLGYKVIRFTNEEVLGDTDNVLSKVSEKLKGQKSPKGDLGGNNVYFLAWTTTPWTLPSNTALCVGPNITYVLVDSFNPYLGNRVKYILAKELLNTHFNPKNADLAFEDYKHGDKNIPFKVLRECKGSDLAGTEYEQLIPWVDPHQKSPMGDLGGSAFRVITGDFVTTEDGTGIVHIAPTFGADDDRVAKQNGVPPLLLIDKDGNRQPMVDRTGKFFKIEDLSAEFVASNVNTGLYGEYAGRYVKNAYDNNLTEDDATLDVDLCVMLKLQGLAFKIEKHTHNYPHCWRTDKPVLYYPLDSWFVKTTACREEMMSLNDTINWKPVSTGTGRFGKWLENLQDWNLSRSRYWGTPLPIWRSEDGTEEICIGSVEELISEIEKSIAAGFMTENPYKNFKVGEYTADNYAVKNIDLHRPYVDGIVLVSASGKPMKRELDLIDVWFDSGAMPYAQLHYPFENKELIDNHTNFPADFISEGVDQTRGWFFTLHAISTMVRGSVAFKNVVSNGLVLDKNGNKMSKRLGNGVDPFIAIEKYGSDPLRWYMMTNASPWDNLKFDVEGIEEVRRKFFGTLYNTYSFFSLYANVDKFTYAEAEVPMENRPEIDRWIISLLNTLVKDVTEHYETYEPTRAGRAISDFVGENLSNWYVRLNRKRYWGGEYNEDKISAYQTLYTCLETVARLISPVAPFFADRLFLDLNAVTGKDTSESVHLAEFPTFNEALIDSNLEECMQLAQQTSSMILALRRKAEKKVRQPLTKAVVPAPDEITYKQLSYIADLVKAEVNVKELEVIPADNDMENMVKKIKPNFKTLGKKYGKQMKEIALAMNSFGTHEITEIERNGQYILTLASGNVELTPEDVEIITEDMPGWLVANEGKLTVALDITVTDALLREGIARELVNRIQNIRKSNGYEIVDKISVEIESRDEIKEAVEEYKNYIASQTLAKAVVLVSKLTDPTELEFDEYVVKVSVKKV